MPALLTARERAVWTAAFVLVAAVIVATHFASADPDSALYAAIAARLSPMPVAHWIAPYWFGLWPGSGTDELFREHPAGIFLVPAALGRLGIPAAQAAYVVGVAAGLGALLLTAHVAARLTSREAGRALLVLLPLMPVAFIFRVRSNHEYPMLLCFALCLLGLEGLGRSWRPAILVVAGLVGGLIVKGVFVLPIVMGCVLWIALDPSSARVRGRQITAMAAGVAAMGVILVLYDAAYLSATGEAFWAAYWRRQISPVTVGTPFEAGGTIGRHLAYYGLRLLWHPAPWSLALIWLGLRRAAATAGSRPALSMSERRGLIFSLAFAAASMALFSLPSRFAERYLFTAVYVIGACGAAAAWRAWPELRRMLARLDAAIPALPAVVWTLLILLRLGLGPWIPRIQDH